MAKENTATEKYHSAWRHQSERKHHSRREYHYERKPQYTRKHQYIREFGHSCDTVFARRRVTLSVLILHVGIQSAALGLYIYNDQRGFLHSAQTAATVLCQLSPMCARSYENPMYRTHTHIHPLVKDSQRYLIVTRDTSHIPLQSQYIPAPFAYYTVEPAWFTAIQYREGARINVRFIDKAW